MWLKTALLSLLVLTPAFAQEGPEAPPAEVDAGTPAEQTLVAAPDSPRASMANFFNLTRAGRDDEAASYLDLPRGTKNGADLARQLKVILDRNLWVELDTVSGLTGGNPDDELPGYTEELGTLPGPKGEPLPVRIVQRNREGATRWVFSRETIANIPFWYASLEDRWLLEHMPAVLMRPGPKALMWWQWLALPLLFLLAWTVGKLLSRGTGFVLGKLVGHTDTHWDDRLVANLRSPITLVWALVIVGATTPFLGLNPAADSFLGHVIRVGFFAAFFWAVLRAVDTGGQFLVTSPWSTVNPGSRSLVPLAARVAKVAVFAVGVVAVVSEMGYPVASLLAGLGIGGLAVALAAQKTVENLFGAFSLGVDQPFRQGDFVKVEDFTGNVESIGLRSTRIRTADRTIITVPNGKLADMRIETFAERDRLRFACIVGLVYSTTADQLRTVLANLEAYLRAHPKIWPDTVVVRFQQLGASSLDIEVNSWFQTTDWNEFLDIRQANLLAIMEIVEKAGSAFAFPTHTVELVSAPPQGTGSSR